MISVVKKKLVMLAVAMVVLCNAVPAWASGEIIGWGRQIVGPIGPVEQSGIGVIS